MAFDLELINVCKTYPGGQPAVTGFSLQANRGEFISIVGPSGCGKTTTLRMIAGFEEITSGQILVRGKDIGRLPPEARPTSTIFQNFALFPHMTVRENIAFGLDVRGIDPAERKRRVERMVALFDLGDVAHRQGAALSGGQRQRVALARGLAVQPDILLLDEPLGALDANLRKSIQHELKLLQREVGITFVFVTHAQSEALVLSDRIVVMNRGNIEQIAAPLSLYTSPKTEFVARFMGRNALFRGTVVERPETPCDALAVTTASGVLCGSTGQGGPLPVGSSALLVVPSEAFDLTPTSDAARTGQGGQLPARVVGRTYCGATVRLALEIGDGRALSVERPVHVADGLADNAQVWLSWPLQEARVIAAQAA